MYLWHHSPWMYISHCPVSYHSVQEWRQKAQAVINPYVVFWPVLCVLMMESECVWALGEGSIFQLLRGLQNWILGHFKQKKQFDKNFTCVDLKLPFYPSSWLRDCPQRLTPAQRLTPVDNCIKTWHELQGSLIVHTQQMVQHPSPIGLSSLTSWQEIV